MEYAIEFGDGDPVDVRVTLSGRADVATLRELNEALVADARFRPRMTILFDTVALAGDALTNSELYAIARSAGELEAQLAPSPIAVVVPDPLAFGQTRLAHSYADAEGVFSLRVFYSVEAAEAWLRG
jgi:hypothetical protein